MKKCPGHFGHIEMVRPVCHSEFGKKLEILMQASCQSCGRIAIPDDKLEQLRMFIGDETIDIAKKIEDQLKTRYGVDYTGLLEIDLIIAIL